jgi:hypothetical protein
MFGSVRASLASMALRFSRFSTVFLCLTRWRKTQHSGAESSIVARPRCEFLWAGFPLASRAPVPSFLSMYLLVASMASNCAHRDVHCAIPIRVLPLSRCWSVCLITTILGHRASADPCRNTINGVICGLPTATAHSDVRMVRWLADISKSLMCLVTTLNAFEFPRIVAYLRCLRGYVYAPRTNTGVLTWPSGVSHSVS